MGTITSQPELAVERKPYSARIRRDLVKSIRILAAQEDTEIYILFEEALQKLLTERKQKVAK